MRAGRNILGTAASATAVAAGIALLAGCAGKPALPKYASVETAARQSSAENFAALVPEADVVYFPVESASHGGRSDPAAQLLTALQKTGAPLAAAWDIIDASQQPLLDELQSAQGNAREALVARLELDGTGRAREYCRSVLRSPESAAIRHLALAPARALAEKVRGGAVLSEAEQAEVPRGFRAPAGEMEAFTQRIAAARTAAEGDVAGLYREHLFAEQFAAEKIARHFQAGGGGKLLVFSRQSDLEPGRGVPFFVTQKVQLRQLVFGSDRTRPGTKLLTDLPPARRVEIVDGAPGAARD